MVLFTAMICVVFDFTSCRIATRTYQAGAKAASTLQTFFFNAAPPIEKGCNLGVHISDPAFCTLMDESNWKVSLMDTSKIYGNLALYSASNVRRGSLIHHNMVSIRLFLKLQGAVLHCNPFNSYASFCMKNQTSRCLRPMAF